MITLKNYKILLSSTIFDDIAATHGRSLPTLLVSLRFWILPAWKLSMQDCSSNFHDIMCVKTLLVALCHVALAPPHRGISTRGAFNSLFLQ